MCACYKGAVGLDGVGSLTDMCTKIHIYNILRVCVCVRAFTVIQRFRWTVQQSVCPSADGYFSNVIFFGQGKYIETQKTLLFVCI